MNIAVKPPLPLVTADELAAVRRPILSASGMPNQAYTDDACFEHERDTLFASNWVALGFAGRYADASVSPIDFMGLPLFISRDKSGEIRVFHNVCSHRGIKLVDSARPTNGLIVCPYHSWTYGLNGALRATPHIGGVGVNQVEGFDCASHGLREISSHIWGGILFMNLDGQAEPFETANAAFLERYRALAGEDAEQLLRPAVDDGYLEMSLHCNWKLAIENYLEAYHLPFIHPGLNSYSPLTAHRNEVFADNCAGQITSTFDPRLDQDNPLPLFPGWDQARLETGEYPALYPNLLLGFQANHLFCLIIHPEAPGRCREELQIFYVGDDSVEAAHSASRQANLTAWTAVFNEDIEPCERMQIGRQSTGYQGGAFSPVHDTCSHHFHQWVAGHYQTVTD